MTETLKKSSAFINLDADEGASEETLALLEAEDKEEEFQFRIFLCTLAIVIPFVVVVISSLVLSSN